MYGEMNESQEELQQRIAAYIDGLGIVPRRGGAAQRCIWRTPIRRWPTWWSACFQIRSRFGVCPGSRTSPPETRRPRDGADRARRRLPACRMWIDCLGHTRGGGSRGSQSPPGWRLCWGDLVIFVASSGAPIGWEKCVAKRWAGPGPSATPKVAGPAGGLSKAGPDGRERDAKDLTVLPAEKGLGPEGLLQPGGLAMNQLAGSRLKKIPVATEPNAQIVAQAQEDMQKSVMPVVPQLPVDRGAETQLASGAPGAGAGRHR